MAGNDACFSKSMNMERPGKQENIEGCILKSELVYIFNFGSLL